jgi:hypothetical protein
MWESTVLRGRPAMPPVSCKDGGGGIRCTRPARPLQLGRWLTRGRCAPHWARLTPRGAWSGSFQACGMIVRIGADKEPTNAAATISTSIDGRSSTSSRRASVSSLPGSRAPRWGGSSRGCRLNAPVPPMVPLERKDPDWDEAPGPAGIPSQPARTASGRGADGRRPTGNEVDIATTSAPDQAPS